MPSSLERYNKMYSNIAKGAYYCGADRLWGEFRVSFWTYFTLTAIAAYYVLSAYTIWLRAADDWLVIPECMVFVGNVIQGMFKYNSAVSYGTRIYKLRNWVNEVYIEYEERGPEYQQCLELLSERLEKIWKVTAILYTSAATGIICMPLIILIITGQKVLIVRYELPIPPTTNLGYILTYTVHSLQCVCAAIGNLCGDFLFMFLATQVVLIADILNLKLKEIDKFVRQRDQSKDSGKLVRDALNWHQQFCRFSKEVDNVMFWQIFAQIASSAVAVAIVIFILIVSDWPAGFPLVGLAFFQIFSYCIVGTIYEIKHDDITDNIYNCLWYKLPVDGKKKILLMLLRSQRPHLFTVGGYIPLNVNTGVQVTKTIYSYMMMLLNFVEK